MKTFLIWLIAYPLLVLAMYLVTNSHNVCQYAGATITWISCR